MVRLIGKTQAMINYQNISIDNLTYFDHSAESRNAEEITFNGSPIISPAEKLLRTMVENESKQLANQQFNVILCPLEHHFFLYLQNIANEVSISVLLGNFD